MVKRESILKRVREFITECGKISVPIDKAILFGSAVKNNGSTYSDIDLALFSEKFTDNILDNIQLIGAVNIRYPDIEVHAFPKEQYLQGGLFMDEIKSSGIDVSA